MRKWIISVFIMLIGCTSHVTDKDIIDKLIDVHRKDHEEALVLAFGQPDEIKLFKSEDRKQYIYFESSTSTPLFQTSIDIKSGKILASALYYSSPKNNYFDLKKRFKNNHWIETEKISPKGVDVASEPYQVEVKDLGLSFEYDNQDPYRKVRWIFFE